MIPLPGRLPLALIGSAYASRAARKNETITTYACKTAGLAIPPRQEESPMPVLHSASYRTSSGSSPALGATARTRHEALRDVRVLLREISSRSEPGNSGVDLPLALGKAVDAWLEARLS